MTAFARTDTSPLSRWWWTVDRWSLAALAALIGFGALLTLSASPPVAERLGLNSFYFAWRQLTLVPIAAAVMFGISLMSPKGVRRLAYIGFAVSLALLAATFFIGEEIKGARRWINLGIVSLQPSEFLKPTFAIITAALFASYRAREFSHGNTLAIALYAAITCLLILQPDVGMSVVISAVWFAQFFMAGLQLQWAVFLGCLGLVGMAGAYLLFPHVANRIDRFLDPSSGDSFQVDKSLEAFVNGGLMGKGPGEGTVKAVLPDAHADFVFAVAGEEFGLIPCLLIVALFAFVVLRGLTRMMQENSLFVMLAASGLVIQFGLQAAVNMGSALRLIPAKGMTLPFISYGGSSLMSVAISVGMLLALTRRRFGRGAS